MIIQFSVENFMSIKEKVIFSMLSSSDKEISENLIMGTKENYLKSAVIYGANASGKSNLIKAINTIIIMMRNSNNMQPGQKLPIILNMYMDLLQIKIKFMKNIYIIIQMVRKLKYLKERKQINIIIQ